MLLSDAQIDSGALARRLLAPSNNLVPVNLLTRQQASLEDAGTAGWVAFAGCTIARSTTASLSGTASLEIVATSGSTDVRTSSGTSGVPVTPGKIYSAVASIRAGASSRTGYISLLWYTSAGVYISKSENAFALVSGSWVTLRTAMVAPATAAFAAIELYLPSMSVSEVAYLDASGIWEGAGGSWVNGGERLDPSTLGWYWDESVGRRLFVWDTINNRWQMVYGDTGWRLITSLANGWAGNLLLRRVGYTVFVRAGLNGTSATNNNFWSFVSGWASPSDGFASTVLSGINNALSPIFAQANTGNAALGTPDRTNSITISGSYMTPDAWPTALPGSAVGSIPNT